MKTKVYLLMAVAALSLGTTSCSDFLDEESHTKETIESYQTQSGLDGLVSSCYCFSRGWYGKEGALGLSEMGTDLFYYGSGGCQKSLCQYNLTSVALANNTTDNPCLDQYWELFYAATDACNNAIKYVSESTILSSKIREQYLGEAKFLRAFYYFHMVNIWGGVPYNSEPMTYQRLNPVRTPENEVYGKILNDLDSSIICFDKAQYRIKEDGRANYWAARALKARVLLYAASWLNGQLGKQVAGNANYSSMDGKALYKAAEAEADAVINSNYASLYDNYNDVWSMNNEGYNINKEALFGITYDGDYTKNCIPYRNLKNTSGNYEGYNSLITRTGYTRGGSAMLLMFVSQWNNGCGDLGGNGTKGSNIFVRALGASTDTIHSTLTNQPVDVASTYSPYGRGFDRYMPSLHLWNLLEEHRSTDQRTEGTLMDHYDIASPDLAGNAKNYPNLKDTAIYYCPLDGNSEAGKAKQAWAKNRYRIQFASGGDIPVYSSSDPATALPTENAKSISDVYGDNRYNSVTIGGWDSYPGIKKFLDNVYNENAQTMDVSYRDVIVMRLPEMYLIKAECQLQDGEGSDAALATLNILRQKRAKAGTDNTLKGTITIDDILNERAIEFCGEQMRWFDLKRTGKLYEYVIKYNAQASPSIKADATKHFLYRPIPQTELDAITNYTDSVGLADHFWQNPGY